MAPRTLSKCEPQRGKTFLLTCVPKKDSNLPMHPCYMYLISLHCLQETKTVSLAMQNAPSEDSDQTAQANLKLHLAHVYEGTFSDVALVVYPFWSF